MKRLTHNRTPVRQQLISAFTATEIMMAIAIFSFVIAGMLSVQLFGLRVYTLAATKAAATTGARETLNSMRDRIRSANVVLLAPMIRAAGRVLFRLPMACLKSGTPWRFNIPT